MTPATRLALARAWLVACVALGLAGPFVARGAFLEVVASPACVHLAHALAARGVPASESVVMAMLLFGPLAKMVVFAFAAVQLVRLGDDRPFPTVLAGGLVVFGVGTALPVAGPPPSHGWVLELDLLLALGTLARATLTLPDEAFLQTWRKVYFAAWLAVLWLVLHPVGLGRLHWTGLRDAHDLSAALHVALFGVGLAAMAARYIEQPPERRQRMKWFVWGIAASIAAFAVKSFLADEVGGEVFARVAYPAIQCCTALALTVAVVKSDYLWRLGETLPEFFGWVAFVVTVAVLSLVLGHVVIAREVEPTGRGLLAVLACVGLSFVVTLVVRGYLFRAVRFVLFPKSGERRRAVELGVSALGDAQTEDEVIWALAGAFEHGWPGCRVQVFRGALPQLTPLKAGVAQQKGSIPPGPDDAQRRPTDAPEGLDGPTLLETAGTAPTLWFKLRAHDEDVGAVRVVPSPTAGFTQLDTEIIGQELVRSASLAVWRVTQHYHFARRS